MQNDKEKFKNEFYERLIEFSLSVIALSDQIIKNRNLYSVADQLVRSSTSVGANVTEAKSSSSKKEYIKYFEIALKSANETIYWIMIVQKACPDLNKYSQELLAETEEIAKILGASIITLKGKR
ncbi:four helix bundle protein [candidate division WS5 bacterium]|uniref:Four helix bundle protein n=1 Tax=candidate division WS5 bacterium TaxID=2093353 RepID=A0A419DG87_9BACT|nr:MAG: four helix bundle protein [candidate division WS5 bacterium]